MTERARRSATALPVGTAIGFLLLGLAAGAALGILYAPKAGRQTRKELNRKYKAAKDSLEDWSEDARDLADQVIERGTQVAEDLRQRVEPLAKTLRNL